MNREARFFPQDRNPEVLTYLQAKGQKEGGKQMEIKFEDER